MKKNLIIALAVLVVAAMAIPASAATLTYTGELRGAFTYDGGKADNDWNYDALLGASRLRLNLTFKEGDSIVGYLPLVLQPFLGAPTVSLASDKGLGGGWYFSYDAKPWAFWLSQNDSDNAKQFASLGDALGILEAVYDSKWALNAAGSVLGANVNLYALELGDSNAYMGRVTYGLPYDFTIGANAAYTTWDDDEYSSDLVAGVDVVGKIPGLGAKLTLAGAGSWYQPTAGDLEFDATGEDYLAYQLALTDINVGPVAAWVKYTAVGGDFYTAYKTQEDPEDKSTLGKILNDYADAAALEAEVGVDIPVGIPAKLTLGNTLWMDYPATLQYNETTAKAVVDPLKDLQVTVSGAYRADLEDSVEDNAGWKVYGDVAYTTWGLTLKPYVHYRSVDGCYDTVDSSVEGFIAGFNAKGSPLAGLTLESDAQYRFENEHMRAYVYGLYATEANPGFVKSAMTKVAGVAGVKKDGAADPVTNAYAYAGSDVVINDQLSAKLGFITRDALALDDELLSLAGHAALTYAISPALSAKVEYTYRQNAALPAAPEEEGDPDYSGMWRPFDDEGKNFFKASVTGTVGASTITLAYGHNGLTTKSCASLGHTIYGNAYDDTFHNGKDWAWLFHDPAAFMNWELLSATATVKF